jgi:hypothetical protein
LSRQDLLSHALLGSLLRRAMLWSHLTRPERSVALAGSAASHRGERHLQTVIEI